MQPVLFAALLQLVPPPDWPGHSEGSTGVAQGMFLAHRRCGNRAEIGRNAHVFFNFRCSWLDYLGSRMRGGLKSRALSHPCSRSGYMASDLQISPSDSPNIDFGPSQENPLRHKCLEKGVWITYVLAWCLFAMWCSALLPSSVQFSSWSSRACRCSTVFFQIEVILCVCCALLVSAIRPAFATRVARAAAARSKPGRGTCQPGSLAGCLVSACVQHMRHDNPIHPNLRRGWRLTVASCVSVTPHIVARRHCRLCFKLMRYCVTSTHFHTKLLSFYQSV